MKIESIFQSGVIYFDGLFDLTGCNQNKEHYVYVSYLKWNNNIKQFNYVKIKKMTKLT